MKNVHIVLRAYCSAFFTFYFLQDEGIAACIQAKERKRERERECACVSVSVIKTYPIYLVRTGP